MNKAKFIDKTIILYFLSVFLLVLSFPKANYFPLAWVALVPIFLSFYPAPLHVRNKNSKIIAKDVRCGVYYLKPVKAFFYGWLFGIIFIGNILIWLYIFGYEPWLAGMLYYGIFYGIFSVICCWFYNKSSPKEYWQRIIFGASCYVLMAEYFRALTSLGITYGDLSVSQYKFLPILQIVPFIGGFGLSFLIAFFNAYLAELIYQFTKDVRRMTYDVRPVASRFMRFMFIFLPPLLVFACIGYGYFKLNSKNLVDYSHSIKISIIQPNINQDVKWDKAYLESTMKTLEDLTFQVKKLNPDMIIWPETAVPDYLLYNYNLCKRVFELVRKNQIYLLTGVPDAYLYKGRLAKYNSVFLLSPDGILQDKYAKRHLVPFGEFIPLKEFFGRFEITKRIGDWSDGEREVIFYTPKGKFGVLICFESVFPYLSRQYCANGADFLVVVTNDAWFKRTAAAEHHLALSLLRGVENGVFMVQAANTGISAYITPEGKILKISDLFIKTILTEEIYLSKRRTFYNIFGDWVIFLSFVAIGILIINCKFRN